MLAKVGALEPKIASQSADSESGMMGKARSSLSIRKGRSNKVGCCSQRAAALAGGKSRTSSDLRSVRRTRRGEEAPWVLVQAMIELLSAIEKEPRTMKG